MGGPSGKGHHRVIHGRSPRQRTSEGHTWEAPETKGIKRLYMGGPRDKVKNRVIHGRSTQQGASEGYVKPLKMC